MLCDGHQEAMQEIISWFYMTVIWIFCFEVIVSRAVHFDELSNGSAMKSSWDSTWLLSKDSVLKSLWSLHYTMSHQVAIQWIYLVILHDCRLKIQFWSHCEHHIVMSYQNTPQWSCLVIFRRQRFYCEVTVALENSSFNSYHDDFTIESLNDSHMRVKG